MEDKVIADFRKKTDMNFHLLDGMTAGEIEQIVLFYVQAVKLGKCLSLC